MFPTNDRLKLTPSRVWKGIFGILDLTNIRREIWENAKYLGGKWDLTGTREVACENIRFSSLFARGDERGETDVFEGYPGSGFTKIWARDAGFFPISVGKPRNRDDSNTRSSGKCDSIRRAFSCVSYQLSKLYRAIWLIIV